MKKSIMKKFSLLLAVVLLVSMMPFAVFADGDNVAPTNVEICDHVYHYYATDYEYVATSSKTTHNVCLYNYYACQYCGDSGKTLASYYAEAHTLTKVKIGNDDNGPLYRYTCTVCGKVYDDN